MGRADQHAEQGEHGFLASVFGAQVPDVACPFPGGRLGEMEGQRGFGPARDDAAEGAESAAETERNRAERAWPPSECVRKEGEVGCIGEVEGECGEVRGE